MNEIVIYHYSVFGYGNRPNQRYNCKAKLLKETPKSYRIQLLEPTNAHNAGDEIWAQKKNVSRPNQEKKPTEVEQKWYHDM